MHERHIEECQALRINPLIVTGSNSFLCQNQRECIGGKTTGVASEQITGELIQHNDFRQATIGRFAPFKQLPFTRRFMGCGESVCYGFVDIIKAVEPLLRGEFVKLEHEDILDGR